MFLIQETLRFQLRPLSLCQLNLKPLLLTMIVGALCLPAAASAQTYTRDELVAHIMQETKLPKALVQPHIQAARFDASLIQKMNTPYESRPYADYRPLFVNEKLKEKAQAYMAEHRVIFDEAQQKYGVAPEIIAAILGMETRFGQNRGKDKVLDALFTLASGYERRADFFRGQLVAFFLLCDEEKLNPGEVLGSYAGAFGTTQFIPTSYRAYAVDADGDGQRDVWNNPKDIIFSVANYFQRHHWNDEKAVAHWIRKPLGSPLVKQALKDETREFRTLHAFKKSGIKKPNQDWSEDDEVALITRQTSEGKRTLLVGRNFYTITRWNRSWNYALAATELASMLGNEKCRVGE